MTVYDVYVAYYQARWQTGRVPSVDAFNNRADRSIFSRLYYKCLKNNINTPEKLRRFFGRIANDIRSDENANWYPRKFLSDEYFKKQNEHTSLQTLNKKYYNLLRKSQRFINEYIIINNISIREYFAPPSRVRLPDFVYHYKQGHIMEEFIVWYGGLDTARSIPIAKQLLKPLFKKESIIIDRIETDPQIKDIVDSFNKSRVHIVQEVQNG